MGEEAREDDLERGTHEPRSTAMMELIDGGRGGEGKKARSTQSGSVGEGEAARGERERWQRAASAELYCSARHVNQGSSVLSWANCQVGLDGASVGRQEGGDTAQDGKGRSRSIMYRTVCTSTLQFLRKRDGGGKCSPSLFNARSQSSF